jgi:hypothetical protein
MSALHWREHNEDLKPSWLPGYQPIPTELLPQTSGTLK